MMSFLQRFFRFFGRSHTRDGVADTVQSEERISRFVFQSNHIHSSGRLRPAALLPEPKPGRYGPETSVCRINGLGEPDIWRIGTDDVGKLRGKPPIGRGDLDVQRARDCALDVVADKESFERHALLIKWPADKEDRKAIALELSQHTIARKPTP